MKIPELKEKITYVSLDGPNVEKINKKIQDSKKDDLINLISYRWIDYSIEKKLCIKHFAELTYLNPFNIKTPHRDFEKLIIYCTGFNEIQKKSIKE